MMSNSKMYKVNENSSNEELVEAAKALIADAKALKEDIETLTDTYGERLEGGQKLSRKVDAEIKFISQKMSQGKLKDSYVSCSNMPYLRSVGTTAKLFPLVTSLLTPFQPNQDNQDLDEDALLPTVIDVVANEGFLWVKVVARNAEGLWNNWTGNCEMSHRSLEEQLEELLSLADLCPVYFRKPTVSCFFSNGVVTQMADDIERMGVKVFGYIKGPEGDVEFRDPNHSEIFRESNVVLNTRFRNQSFLNEFTTVNLDVSTILALCSNLTHGSCDWDLPNSTVLNLQVRDESKHHMQLWNELDSFLKDKRMVCCETAYSSYSEILNIVGGRTEKKRSELLFQQIEIVPDVFSSTVDQVPISSAVKERSKIIFGTGFEMKAVTVTSNLSCVRSMRQMGIYFPVFAHVARALTEQKEANAQEVDLSQLSTQMRSAQEASRTCNCYLCSYANGSSN